MLSVNKKEICRLTNSQSVEYNVFKWKDKILLRYLNVFIIESKSVTSNDFNCSLIFIPRIGVYFRFNTRP